jgi:hypothetical protein
MIEQSMELFALLGAPARLVGRRPLMTRYLWNGFSNIWPNPEYALARYGKYYHWRPWLLFDVQELELVEDIVNRWNNERVIAFRQNQLYTSQLIAIIVGPPYISMIQDVMLTNLTGSSGDKCGH